MQEIQQEPSQELQQLQVMAKLPLCAEKLLEVELNYLQHGLT